jgi:hypothetical protein
MNDHKNSGGNTMSLKKTATRRLSLLAGSSLIAGLLSAAGVALAPSAASAQAVCVPAPSTGGGTNTVTYSPGIYDPGITCTAVGGAMSVSTGGAVTVSSTDPTPLVNDSGVNLIGGAQSVTWNSAAGALIGGAQTSGPVLDVSTTGNGAINITTGVVTATAAGATHGIRATAGGVGNISITRNGAVNNNSAGSVAAIELVSNGGNITYADGGPGATTGRLRGIVAQTSGAGSVSITKTSGNINTADATGRAIDVVAGTGGFNLLMNGLFTINFGNPGRAALRVASAGGATVNVQGGALNGGLDFAGVTGSGVTMNVTGSGTWDAGGSTIFSGLADLLTFSSTSSISSLLNGGVIDFAAGSDRLNIDSGYAAGAATIAFGAGADRVDITGLLTANGTLVDFGADADTLNLSGTVASNDATFDFGAGTDVLNLTGALVVNGVTINNLEAFNHSGVIHLGGNATVPDGDPDDVLRLSSGTFTGSGTGRVVMDINIGGGAQAGCEVLTLADCLDFRGATTAGQTFLTLNSIGDAASAGGYDPSGITLVDVGGGTSAADHFALDPDMVGVETTDLYGDVIARPGLFVYALRYDPETQRHNLIGLPRREILDYAVVGSAAQSVWYMTAASVTDRQTDLRGGKEGEVWLRASGEYDKRDMATAFDTGVGTMSVDNSYKQYSGSVVGGMDFVTGTSGGYDYVLGGQIGYVTSSLELTAADSSGRMTGGTGGVYGSMWNQRFFFDGTFNANVLTLDYDSPGLGSKTNTYLNSVGAQLEGGMRQMLTARSYVEPLVTAAFVNTTFEEISLTGGEVRPDKASSRRAALGLRAGSDLTGGAINVSYFVTGRAWNEFGGESGVVINNPGADLVLVDDFSGSFGEAEAGVNLFNDAGTLSGFLTSGVKFKDGYDAVNLSLGLNMRW